MTEPLQHSQKYTPVVSQEDYDKGIIPFIPADADNQVPKSRIPATPKLHTPEPEYRRTRVTPSPIAHIPIWIRPIAAANGTHYLHLDGQLVFENGTIWSNTGLGWQLQNPFSSRLDELYALHYYHSTASEQIEDQLRQAERIAKGHDFASLHWDTALYGIAQPFDLVGCAEMLSSLWHEHVDAIEVLEHELEQQPEVIRKRKLAERNEQTETIRYGNDRNVAMDVSRILRETLGERRRKQ